MISIRNRIIQAGSIASVAICMALIFWFSAQPAKESSQMSGGITDEVIAAFLPGYSTWPSEIQQGVFHTVEIIIRKSAHFSVYALLGMLCMFAASRFFRKRPVQFLSSCAVCIIYAAGDEFHQLFVPGRSCEFRDVCIDTAGAVLGILIIWMTLHLITRMKARRIKKRIMDHDDGSLNRKK